MSLSILLVDDSKIVRKVIAKELPIIFRDQELKLTEATNGEEALTYLFANNYDLVFLDLTMPVKTGYEVLEALKEKGVRANIIVLTADIQPDAEKIVRELGAIGYIKKERPFNTNPLMKILQDTGML
ncbi:Response regulator [Desulfamplus magnetovallimortis]|uniref:Response regulator n=1 Tax=Desulfamplus magnetovallimortis TaxID=1246637 RepID=A0A1W1H5I1_9BACT|nr:response regulator [Desulfamplus magnetovallimortis]SLM27635.1 Response regulator [Desulfamplus magnetovallimortis]